MNTNNGISIFQNRFSGENLFFTSDTHFCHENIIRFCNRPFGSVKEMNEALIHNWNETVPEDGTVFHLGDFAFGGAAGRELDLIPKRKDVKTPDSFDKGDGRFVEFKTNSSATANSIDRALRDASHQADNIVISLERGLPLGTLTSVVHERVRREDNIKTVCIIKDGKDVLLKRAEILREGFKIEEADFK